MRHEVIHDAMISVHHSLDAGVRQVYPDVQVTIDVPSGPVQREPSRLYLFPYDLQLNENGASVVFPRDQVVKGEEDAFVFHPRPIPLTLSFLIYVEATNPVRELGILGRAIQVVQESPALTGERLKGALGSWQDKLIVAPDIDMTADRILNVFRAYQVTPRLAVGYLVKTKMQSEKVIREATGTRSVQPRLEKKPRPEERRNAV